MSFLKKLVLLTILSLTSAVAGAETGTVNTDTIYQSLEGFGAAHVWSGSTLVTLGNNHPEIYDVLFADLGLDIVRLRNNYGYGNEFDYDYLANCEHAITNGRERTGRPLKIMISAWSPPASLKSNASIKGGGEATLAKSGGRYVYAEYANWWADSVAQYASQGMLADYISIQNEPDWDPSDYESCRFEPSETASIAGYAEAFEAVYSKLYTRMGSSMPKMLAPETTGFTGAKGSSLSTYIAALSDLSHVYGYAHHLYNCNDGGNAGCGGNPDNYLSNMRSFGRSYNTKPILQTEYSDAGQVTSFNACINLAVLMHNSLVEEGVAGYIYWQLTWGTGGLVSITTDSWSINPIYYAMLHYSRYTDPGWRRVAASTSTSSLRISAYLSPGNNELSIVVINTAYTSTDLSLNLGAFAPTGSGVYQTTEAAQNAYIGTFSEPQPLSLPGRSITTINLTKGGGSQGTPPPTRPPTPTPLPTTPPTPSPTPVDCSNAQPWDAAAIYDTTGIRVIHNGNLYQNKWYSSGQNPAENSGEFKVWTLLGTCAGAQPPTPTQSSRKGDVNSDGSINIVDALMTAQYYVGLTPAGFNAANADVNCDGSVNIVDALMIAQYYVGLVLQFC